MADNKVVDNRLIIANGLRESLIVEVDDYVVDKWLIINNQWIHNGGS